MAILSSRFKLSGLLLACGLGVSVQFLASSLETLIFGNVIQIAVGADKDNMARSGRGTRACEAAKRHALEVAPELLSLADWPLDEHLPAECMSVPGESLAAIDDPLPEAIEIADVPPVITVVASVFGEDAPVAMKSPPVQPRNVVNQSHPLGQQIAAVNTASLDEIRGGFEMKGSGLQFSIGIERAVFINGNLIATNVLNLKDLQSVAGGASVAAGAVPTVSSTGALIVQNGAENYVASQVRQNPAATVIQNTLNDQRIQSVTTINANVNSMQMARAISLQNAIQTGIVSSLRR